MINVLVKLCAVLTTCCFCDTRKVRRCTMTIACLLAISSTYIHPNTFLRALKQKHTLTRIPCLYTLHEVSGSNHFLLFIFQWFYCLGLWKGMQRIWDCPPYVHSRFLHSDCLVHCLIVFRNAAVLFTWSYCCFQKSGSLVCIVFRNVAVLLWSCRCFRSL